MSPRALACPASLKGVLSALGCRGRAGGRASRRAGVGVRRAAGRRRRRGDARRALRARSAASARRRRRRARAAAGRARWRCSPDGTAVVEAAEAIPLDPSRLDVDARRRAAASASCGRGARRDRSPGRGRRRHGDDRRRRRAARGARRAARRRRACSATCATRCYDAPRLFGPQKGGDAGAGRRARAAASRRCERSLPTPSCPAPARPAASARRSRRSARELVPGADAVLDADRLRPGAATTSSSPARARSTRRRWRGRRPAEVARRCAAAGVRCVVFGGRVRGTVPSTVPAELVALSGDPARARDDLVELGERV